MFDVPGRKVTTFGFDSPTPKPHLAHTTNSPDLFILRSHPISTVHLPRAPSLYISPHLTYSQQVPFLVPSNLFILYFTQSQPSTCQKHHQYKPHLTHSMLLPSLAPPGQSPSDSDQSTHSHGTGFNPRNYSEIRGNTSATNHSISSRAATGSNKP
jgi:hypothetical protein